MVIASKEGVTNKGKKAGSGDSCQNNWAVVGTQGDNKYRVCVKKEWKTETCPSAFPRFSVAMSTCVNQYNAPDNSKCTPSYLRANPRGNKNYYQHCNKDGVWVTKSCNNPSLIFYPEKGWCDWKTGKEGVTKKGKKAGSGEGCTQNYAVRKGDRGNQYRVCVDNQWKTETCPYTFPSFDVTRSTCVDSANNPDNSKCTTSYLRASTDGNKNWYEQCQKNKTWAKKQCGTGLIFYPAKAWCDWDKRVIG